MTKEEFRETSQHKAWILNKFWKIEGKVVLIKKIEQYCPQSNINVEVGKRNRALVKAQKDVQA